MLQLTFKKIPMLLIFFFAGVNSVAAELWKNKTKHTLIVILNKIILVHRVMVTHLSTEYMSYTQTKVPQVLYTVVSSLIGTYKLIPLLGYLYIIAL